VSERLRWFLPHHPDVLGLLRKQADVTSRGVAAFARWSATGDAADAQAVRDAEHDGDDLRHELLQALSTALTTPIEQEDAYALSERIDEVLDRARTPCGWRRHSNGGRTSTPRRWARGSRRRRGI
jgi:uncharacterized protein Yka (UPF0111/DUF47 family)